MITIARQVTPLLGRHVIRRPQHLSGDSEIGASGWFRTGDFAQLRDAQIEQLHYRLAACRRFSDHNVFGF